MTKFYTLTALLLSLCFQLFSQTALTDNSFIKLVTYPTGKTSTKVEDADLDGDGKADVVVANFGGNSISLLRNISSGGVINFAPQLNIPAGENVEAVTIADINLDGKPDVIAAVHQNTVAIYLNQSTPGAIAFASAIVMTTNEYPVDIEAADIDGDGYSEIAVINNQYNSVSVYANADHAGGVNMQLQLTVPTNGAGQDIIFAQINDDDKPDMIVTNFFSSSVSVYMNNSQTGNISFENRVEFTTEVSPDGVRAGDINGDGKADLVLGYANSYSFSVLVNKSIGDNVGFLEKQDFLTGQTPYGIAIADLDNDGKADIATGNYSENTISVFINTTPAGSDSVQLGPLKKYDNTDAPYDMIALDVDGDGYKELITANFSTEGSISVFNNRINGSPVIVPNISSFSPIMGPVGTTVTINGSGFSEVPSENKVFFGSIEAIVLSATSTKITVNVPAGAAFGSISVMRNSFIGYSPYPFNVTFAGGGGGVVYNADFFSIQADLPGNNPRTIKFADFDGDKKPDIAFTQQAGNLLTVYLNTSGTGLITYDQKVDLETGPDPFDLTVCDFNGDGKPDIAVTNFNAGQTSSVSIFENKSTIGHLSFAEATTLDAGSGALGIVSSDFDFDGKTDLGFSAGNAGQYYYFKNISGTDKISFQSLESIANWSHGSTLADGDIDGDGVADVISTDFSDETITVYVNEGTKISPIFKSSTSIGVGTNPGDVVIGDLDGDGKLDVVVTNFSSNTASVLRNVSTVGNVAFETAATLNTGTNPKAVTLGDFDGDGKLEIIIASRDPGKVGIYKNLSSSGQIKLGEAAYYQTGDEPTDVACGDLDGDGKIDLAIANGYNTVTVLRNVYGEATVQSSGDVPFYGAIMQQAIYDSTVNTYHGQAYVQRHFEVTPVHNPDVVTGTVKLYFRQADFDAFNEHPDHGVNMPTGPNDKAGIANLRVYQYHGTSTEGRPGTYSGTTVVIDPDDANIKWNADIEWWEISFEVKGFSGFFVSGPGKGLIASGTDSENKLSIYSNPAHGTVTVKHPVSNAAFIRIIDMRGNVMRVVPLKNDASQSQIRLNGLAAGIYKLVWQNVNSTYVRTLVVK